MTSAQEILLKIKNMRAHRGLVFQPLGSIFLF